MTETPTAIAEATTAGADGVPEIDVTKIAHEEHPQNVRDLHDDRAGGGGFVDTGPGDDGGTLGTGGRTEEDM